MQKFILKKYFGKIEFYQKLVGLPLRLNYNKLSFEMSPFLSRVHFFTSDSCLDIILIPYFYLQIVTKLNRNIVFYVGPTNVIHLFDHLLWSIFFVGSYTHELFIL